MSLVILACMLAPEELCLTIHIYTYTYTHIHTYLYIHSYTYTKSKATFIMTFCYRVVCRRSFVCGKFDVRLHG